MPFFLANPGGEGNPIYSMWKRRPNCQKLTCQRYNRAKLHMPTTSRLTCRKQPIRVMVALCLMLLASTPAAAQVTEVPEAVRKKFDLDADFYKKHVDYKGLSILGSAKVSDK